MVDGIDGSGKSTIIETWKKTLQDQGNTIFDLKQYLKENDRYPELSEFAAYDFIFSAEPTYTGAGKILREELASTHNNYSPETIAEAFSVDRMILYTKALIPALNRGQIIIQDRGLSTSLCYQPCQNPLLTIEKLAAYSGNRLAATYRPDHLVLVDIDPSQAYHRLTARNEKQDNVIFEKLDFMKQAAEKFNGNDFKNFFLGLGTQIDHLQGEAEIDIMKQEAVTLLKKLLKL